MTKETEYPVANPVNASGAAQLNANVIAASAGVPGAFSTGNPNIKTYFVAFDGTGNNKDDADRAHTNQKASANDTHWSSAA